MNLALGRRGRKGCDAQLIQQLMGVTHRRHGKKVVSKSSGIEGMQHQEPLVLYTESWGSLG